MTDLDQSVRRPEGARIGYAGGAFDFFHIGHLNILKHARGACDYLVAGVVADEALVATRGHGPIVPLSERLEIVRHITFVDEVYPETAIDKLETWNEVRFDIYFKGDDWKGTPRGRELERAFARVGVEVVYFPYTVTTSSSILRQALSALEAPDAPERTESEG